MKLCQEYGKEDRKIQQQPNILTQFNADIHLTNNVDKSPLLLLKDDPLFRDFCEFTVENEVQTQLSNNKRKLNVQTPNNSLLYEENAEPQQQGSQKRQRI